MKIARSFKFSCLALVVLIALSGQAFSTTVAVGTCTRFVHFATIQLAVNSVPAGSTIDICPGNYPEQVTINKSLTLKGVASASGDQTVVILPPASGMVANGASAFSGAPIMAQIAVTAGPFSISNITVDGTGNGISDCPNFDGILITNASGTINHVAARNQVPGTAPSSCGYYANDGIGIYVQAVQNSPSKVTIENSSVHNYNLGGIVGNLPGTTLNVTGNYVQGAGVVPYPGMPQLGIQLGFGAAGTINNNTVIDNIYGDPTEATACNIILYEALDGTALKSAITISGNIVGNSQCPIALVHDSSDYWTGQGFGVPPYDSDYVTVTSNKIFGSSLGVYAPMETADGIDVCSTGNTITKNTIFNSAESGVHLDAACSLYFGDSGVTGNDNTVNGNTILESACAGILDDTGGATNTYGTEIYYTVPFPLALSTSACTGPHVRATTAHKFSVAR